MQVIRTLVERLKLSLIVMVILIGLLLAGIFSPMSDEEGREIQKILEGLNEENLELEIFSNNMMIALLGMIPFAGPPLTGYIVFNTGRFLGWTSARMGIPTEIMITLTLIVILAMGYGILELLGYGLAVTESLTVSYYTVHKRQLLRKELRILLIVIALSALLLALGAVIEATLVKSLGNVVEMIETI